MDHFIGANIFITGIVQGVGFRPYIYQLATQNGLPGWVRNTSSGVEIRIDGTAHSVDNFINRIKQEAPPLAQINTLEIEYIAPGGFQKFEILDSLATPGLFQPISPDICICEDCLRELFDPGDRRYRYPFINCTNCGPRLTIIQDIPYDRPNTTMSGFQLCPQCAEEYHDPMNRRFHAQPIACPICGPQVWLETARPQADILSSGDEAILGAQSMLAEGKILAIKGLGGFHLACDALNTTAVAELRDRKLRVDKPFALMLPDLKTVEKHCYVIPAEAELLQSRGSPIVILERKPGSSICAQIAPGQSTIGVMLPYTPLHHLLFSTQSNAKNPDANQLETENAFEALMMTSGNLSEEPIVTDNQDARQRLSNLSDAILTHDRPIHLRCDDSVVRIFSPGSSPYYSRRSRGYAPAPIVLPRKFPPILATGAELKNTFCLTNDAYAFVSHHIGDMENYETLTSFEQGITHFENLFRIQPRYFAYDLHPDYLATNYALERSAREGLPAIGIQHHHAHIASCMIEHKLPPDETVIGVAFDGTGYGADHAIWGGEFLATAYPGYQRAAHLDYVPLPGGDRAIRKPARTALAYLWQSGLEWAPDLPPVAAMKEEELLALRNQLDQKINTPLTSSMGRLFDAVASIIGIRHQVNYEAQAAIEMESIIDPAETGHYIFYLIESPDPITKESTIGIDSTGVIRAVVKDYRQGLPANLIAARFHNGVSNMVLELCRNIRSKLGLEQVVLSGGVWQNMYLLTKTCLLLKQDRFTVYIHEIVPTNDGGISLGQAAIAASIVSPLNMARTGGI